ncbi:hypothetical protein BGZ68_005472 [Mortierella alpina]|nr:hypothetical protein BGZ68_005472 [Mortierella alpina]
MLQQRSPVSTVLLCTPTSQAITLPEVLLRVGCYLDGYQARICSQVCSTWYINFSPLLWENLHIGEQKTNASAIRYTYQREPGPRIRSIHLVSKGRNPKEQLDIIRNKARWLRSLTIHNHVSPQQFTLGKECTQLQAISIAGTWPVDYVYTREYWNSYKALIEQNRSTLTSLTLKKIRCAWPTSTPYWNLDFISAGLTNLTKLEIEDYYIDSQYLESFWKICERLEKLTLKDVSLGNCPIHYRNCKAAKEARAAREKVATSASEDSDPPPPPLNLFPNLRELTVWAMGYVSYDHLDLIIVHCPRLESLCWDLQYNPIECKTFCEDIAAVTWPLLDKIQLNMRFKSSRDSNDVLATIFQHTKKPLKRFSTAEGHFPKLRERAYNLVKERHFLTLQEMNLTLYVWEPLIQDVLASCPSLEVVSGIRLCAAPVLGDKRPWACLGLKEFRMSLEISKKSPWDSPQSFQKQSQEESRALFTQLGRLRHLRSLSLVPTVTSRDSLDDKEPFSLRLDLGLDLLAGNTQLEVIQLHKDQDMGRKDILWMIEHLTSLRMISGGRLNSKKVESKAFCKRYPWDFELAKILNSHGIETPSSIYEEGYLNDVRHLLGKGWPENDDLLYVVDEPAPLIGTVQTLAPAQTIQAVVFEDAVQAVVLEEAKFKQWFSRTQSR